MGNNFDRRNFLKLSTGALGGITLTGIGLQKEPGNSGADVPVVQGHSQSFASDWSNWPDMNWVGPEFWGNRLQDWRIHGGKLECLVKGRNRTLHSLTTQLGAAAEPFETSTIVQLLGDSS